MKYRINSTGDVILADLDFVQRYYPGDFTQLPDDAPILPNVMTSAAFWGRFTNGELVAFEVACQHNPADTVQGQNRSAKLRIFRREVDRDGYFDITQAKRANKVTGLLVTETVLTAPRATSILTDPITGDEVYHIPRG